MRILDFLPCLWGEKRGRDICMITEKIPEYKSDFLGRNFSKSSVMAIKLACSISGNCVCLCTQVKINKGSREGPQRFGTSSFRR